MPPPNATAYPPPPPPQWSPPAEPARTNGLAIATLITGLIGLCGIPYLLGFLALRRIKERGEGGRGLAITGMVLMTVWIAVIGGIAAIAAVGDRVIADRDETGTITEPGRGLAQDLERGDCLADLPEDGELFMVRLAPCSDPHVGEVFVELAVTTGSDPDPYPGIDEVLDQAERRCSESMERDLPAAFDDPSVGLYYLYPTEDSWAMGDVTITCLATTEEPTSGSLLEPAE